MSDMFDKKSANIKQLLIIQKLFFNVSNVRLFIDQIHFEFSST